MVKYSGRSVGVVVAVFVAVAIGTAAGLAQSAGEKYEGTYRDNFCNPACTGVARVDETHLCVSTTEPRQMSHCYQLSYCSFDENSVRCTDSIPSTFTGVQCTSCTYGW